jgi:hypothetical protein
MSAQGNPRCPSQTGMWMDVDEEVDVDAVIVADLLVHVSK